MVRVTITCWECGTNLKFTSDDCVLRLANKPARGDLNRLCYPCAECQKTIVQPIEQHVIAQLVTVGTRVEVIDIPMEVLEPYPAGDPITYDDILNLHEELRHAR